MLHNSAKRLLPLVTLGILCACGGAKTGKVLLREDTFRNIRSFHLVLRVMPEESGAAENPRMAKLEFMRDEAAKSGSSLSLTLKVDEADAELTKEIFYKLDGKTGKFAIGDIESRTASQQYLRSVNEFGTVGFNSTTSATLNSRLYRMRIVFDAAQETALKNCSAFQLRLYLGNDALNLNLSKSDIAAIRKFFAGVADETVQN